MLPKTGSQRNVRTVINQLRCPLRYWYCGFQKRRKAFREKVRDRRRLSLQRQAFVALASGAELFCGSGGGDGVMSLPLSCMCAFLVCDVRGTKEEGSIPEGQHSLRGAGTRRGSKQVIYIVCNTKHLFQAHVLLVPPFSPSRFRSRSEPDIRGRTRGPQGTELKFYWNSGPHARRLRFYIVQL